MVVGNIGCSFLIIGRIVLCYANSFCWYRAKKKLKQGSTKEGGGAREEIRHFQKTKEAPSPFRNQRLRPLLFRITAQMLAF